MFDHNASRIGMNRTILSCPACRTTLEASQVQARSVDAPPSIPETAQFREYASRRDEILNLNAIVLAAARPADQALPENRISPEQLAVATRRLRQLEAEEAAQRHATQRQQIRTARELRMQQSASTVPMHIRFQIDSMHHAYRQTVSPTNTIYSTTLASHPGAQPILLRLLMGDGHAYFAWMNRSDTVGDVGSALFGVHWGWFGGEIHNLAPCLHYGGERLQWTDRLAAKGIGMGGLVKYE
ncbi:hypothetical protein BU16DRAFT_524997 [Lophium mytilinum]|uniref:Uncharacterized protein n=1 Tax=Lophium mytilinum TaxID=390894 RepID=A0A6A6QXZ6_9PEZI|nr:hypothetical protein BU16DRAFT_524997 [Lophium mytilinum]